MTLVINRANKGKRKGSKCVKATRKLRHARSCTYYTKVKSLSHKDVAGTNTLTFSTKGLKPGTYQLVATPHSSSGKAGRAITITFHEAAAALS
jgi:plastocyanin